jgi:uncharacterized membrane protein YbhN (UPF0104 family)
MSGAPARRRRARGDVRTTAPVDENGNGNGNGEDERPPPPPRLEFTARNVLVLAGFLVASLAALYYLLPQIAGLDDTWHRIENGSPYWMFLALLFTAGMFGGYVMMFRGVFVRADGGTRIGWRESYQITMAGLAASRVFAAGGAGGLVLTAWALRRSGMRKRRVADTTLSFLILTYFPYVMALIICGFGLRYGLFPGDDPFGLTVVPATLALIALAIGLLFALVPTDLQRRLGGWARRGGRLARLAQLAANAPASASAGMRDAIAHLRSRDPALLGAILFWAFQILVVWAAFRAFGDAPPAAVLVQGFFVGMLGNLLPMPGGVGGVEGGMIASYAAFGVDGGLAVVAVLVYRAFTFWLPLIPGVIAYFQLRKTVEQWSLSYTK